MIFRVKALWGAALAWGLISATPARAAVAGCNESCLKGVMDGYLQALARHDPSSLPLAKAYRASAE